MTVIHESALDAVHGHAEGSVTATEPCAPLAGTDVDTGANVAVQTTPACVTVNVCPPAVIVPVRLLRLVFAAIEYPTVPSPVPLAPDVMLIQEAEAVAFQVQPGSVSTLTVPVAASLGMEVLTGESANVHVCPACVTVNVWPAIVIVPVREDVVEFAATLYVTWPLPEPLLPVLTVNHCVLVDAVHAHPVPAVTETLPVADAAPIEVLVGEMLKVQGTGASWVTVNVRPAIVTVPARCVVPVFAAIEYPTVPLPLPLAPEVIVIQEAELDAVHVQPVVVVTLTDPVEALDETDVALGEME